VVPGQDRQNRRGGREIVLPVFLADGRCSIEMADGEVVGVGFKPFLDEARTVELIEDEQAPVLPGVVYTRVAGVPFHDDVIQLPVFGAGKSVEIRPEPGNLRDRNALAVFGDGHRVGYLPDSIASVLAPAGTRVGHGVILMEWSTNGMRHGIWVLGSMHVHFSLYVDK
jgi:hypothetical protein